jgi:hypothetical protein
MKSICCVSRFHVFAADYVKNSISTHSGTVYTMYMHSGSKEGGVFVCAHHLMIQSDRFPHTSLFEEITCTSTLDNILHTCG